VVVERLRLLGTVGDRGESGPRQLRNGAEHVENGSRALQAIEPQLAARQGQDVVSSQRSDRRRLHVVGRDVELLLAGGGREHRALRFVGAPGEVRERLVWVGGAARPEVQFDRERLPGTALVSGDHEVDRESTDDTGARELLRDAPPEDTDRRSV
jgi:hypothetical protein